MRNTRVATIYVDRPFVEVFEFLGNPVHFPEWAGPPGSTVEHIEEFDWLVEVPSGQLVLRVSPKNDFGILDLDYAILPPGAECGPVNSARLIPNDDGCDLILLMYQNPGISDEQFQSDVDWMESDLQRMKSLLELR